MARNSGNRTGWFQKGVRVEWFDGHLKGTGTIKRVLANKDSIFENEFLVTDDATQQVFHVDSLNIKKIDKKK